MDFSAINDFTTDALRERMEAVNSGLVIRDEAAVSDGIRSLLSTVTDIVSDQSAAFALTTDDPSGVVNPYEEHLTYLGMAEAVLPGMFFRRTAGLLFILCESLHLSGGVTMAASQLLTQVDGVLASFGMGQSFSLADLWDSEDGAIGSEAKERLWSAVTVLLTTVTEECSLSPPSV